MKVVILDLDGTISNDSRRLPLIDHSAPDPWRNYHEHCHEDPLINEHLLDTQHAIAIFTARPKYTMDQTRSWLAKNGVRFSWLYMREEGCLLPSKVLKKKFLDHLRIAHGVRDVVAAYDDREDVCQMFAREGIPTWLIVNGENLTHACEFGDVG